MFVGKGKFYMNSNILGNAFYIDHVLIDENINHNTHFFPLSKHQEVG